MPVLAFVENQRLSDKVKCAHELECCNWLQCLLQVVILSSNSKILFEKSNFLQKFLFVTLIKVHLHSSDFEQRRVVGRKKPKWMLSQQYFSTGKLV